mmetsp:Transcript_32256/g.64281  ORF Transcript_32256/g.64281 Transcript_32256/m.64281 type:complete len:363 (+) Transcript_32256:399-1487(+)
MQYLGKMKLGQPSFRILQQPTAQSHTTKWVVRAQLGDDQMGYGEGESKDEAMDKAALVTLHLFDPVGKSLAANILHPDPAQLVQLAKDIENVKPEDIAAARGGGGGGYGGAMNPSIMPPGSVGMGRGPPPPQMQGFAPHPFAGGYGAPPPPMPYGAYGAPPPMPYGAYPPTMHAPMGGLPQPPMPAGMPGMLPRPGFAPPGGLPGGLPGGAPPPPQPPMPPMPRAPPPGMATPAAPPPPALAGPSPSSSLPTRGPPGMFARGLPPPPGTSAAGLPPPPGTAGLDARGVAPPPPPQPRPAAAGDAQSAGMLLPTPVVAAAAPLPPAVDPSAVVLVYDPGDEDLSMEEQRINRMPKYAAMIAGR